VVCKYEFDSESLLDPLCLDLIESIFGEEFLIESLLEKVQVFDKDGSFKVEIDSAMEKLKEFRLKYPFVENPKSIDNLEPNDIFKEHPDEVGEFFHWIEFYLKPIGHLPLYGSNVYRQIRAQIDDFKELLHVAVDPKKTLAEKVDAPWDQIKGLGDDRHIAKKIIFCFNYENGDVLPIFKTQDLEYFVDAIVDKPGSFQVLHSSVGETYESLISELIRTKQNLPETQSWDAVYFGRFLYAVYPPPRIETPVTWTKEHKQIDEEQRIEQEQFAEFVKLLNELQNKQRISAEEFRSYSKHWREQPEDRELLTERLKLLLKK
jgi:hypothetical protein